MYCNVHLLFIVVWCLGEYCGCLEFFGLVKVCTVCAFYTVSKKAHLVN